MNLAAVSAVAVSILAAAAAPVAAQAPGDTPPAGAPYFARPAEQVVTVTHTYRSHLILSDLAALGLAAGLGPDHGGQIGSLVYLGAPAMIHVAHGNSSAAWKSVGLRLGLPAAGAMIGAVAMAQNDDCGGDACGGYVPLGIILGGGAGMVTAMIVDWAYLGKKTEQRRTGVGWAPTAAVTPDGVAFGAVGRF